MSPHERRLARSKSSSPLVLSRVRPLEAMTVPVAAALGRTLREPLRARVDIPVFDNSAMDGFAVHFADVDGCRARSSRPAHCRRRPARRHGARPAARPGAGGAHHDRVRPCRPPPTRSCRSKTPPAGSPTRSARSLVRRAPRARRRAHPASRRGRRRRRPSCLPRASARTAAARGGRGGGHRRRRRLASARASPSSRRGRSSCRPGSRSSAGRSPSRTANCSRASWPRRRAEVVLRLTVPDDGDGPLRAVAEACRSRRGRRRLHRRRERRSLRTRQADTRGHDGVHEGRACSRASRRDSV